MRRLRSLLLTTSIAAAAALAPGASAWAQGKTSQPPTPSTGATGAKPAGSAPSSAPTPAGTTSKPGTAAPTGTGTGTTTSKTGTGTGSSTAPTQGTGTGTATGTGTGTGTGTASGTGTGTATGTGTGTGAATGTPEKPADSAETLFRKGNELAKKDGWDKAEPLYREAWKLKQSYDIAANLGLALFQQQKWREAAEFLSFALRSFPASGKPENRALLESAFSQVKAEVGTLTIDVSVNGANVSVDGRAVGISPIKEPVFVDPGKRTIDVTLDEYTPGSKTVDAPKGSSQDVRIQLIPKPKTPPPPITGWRPRPIYFIVGGSVAVAGLGVGVVMTAISNGKSSDADALGSAIPLGGCYRPTAGQEAICAELKETLADQGLFARAAVGSFAVAGIFSVATAALMLYAGSKEFGDPNGPGRRSAASSLQLVPVVDSTRQGLVMVGSW